MPTGGRPSGWKLELRPTESQDPGRAAGLQTGIRKPSFPAQRKICRWSRGEALFLGWGSQASLDRLWVWRLNAYHPASGNPKPKGNVKLARPMELSGSQQNKHQSDERTHAQPRNAWDSHREHNPH